MAEKVIFWIGVIAIGSSALQFTCVLTGVFLGWMLKKFQLGGHYAYFAELFDKRDV